MGSSLLRRTFERAAVEPIPARAAYVLGAALGAAVALHVFGLSFVLGTSPFWDYPPGDASMQLTGYRYFVVDAWRWPILRTTSIGAPEGVNVLQLDVIPLVAIAGKLWRGLTGRLVNPYGLWMLACYALQGAFAARLARAMGERTAIGAVVASVVALAAPAFLLRFYHQGLCAQFIVLWSLAFYFEAGRDGRRLRPALSAGAILVVALLCHPYFVAMVALVVAAAFVRGWRRRSRRENLESAGALLAALASLVVIAFATGHLSGSVVAALSFDYGKASLNVLAPFVPLPGASSLWKDAPVQDGTGVQWDGAFFLGFGVLALLLVHLAASRRRLCEAAREHAFLLACFAVLVLYAFSNRVYVSTKLVATYPIPRSLDWVTGQLRATGRMFWPVGYFVVLAAPVAALRWLRRELGVALACACALVHATDAQASMRRVHDNTRASWPKLLEWEEWRAVIRAHAQVRQIPSFACAGVFGVTPWGFESRELHLIAATEDRPINGVRMARGSPDDQCERELARFGDVEDEDDVLVLFPRLERERDPARCVPAASFHVCSRRVVGDPRLLEKTRLDPTPPYALGSMIHFLPEHPRSGIVYLEPAWGPYEGERIWIGEREANMRLRVSPEKADGYELVLNAEAMLAPSHPSATLRVLSRGVELGAIRFTLDDNRTDTPRTLRLPPSIAVGGEIRLAFRADDPIVPAEHGVIGPRTRVGVAIHRFWLR